MHIDTKRIMVVEDENIVALDIMHTLIKLGYKVTSTVSSGEQAIQKIKDDKPNLILMDIMLSGYLNGVQAAEIISEEYQIPIIFVSAYPSDKTLAGTNLKPFGYLLKPVSEYQLFEAIEGNQNIS